MLPSMMPDFLMRFLHGLFHQLYGLMQPQPQKASLSLPMLPDLRVRVAAKWSARISLTRLPRLFQDTPTVSSSSPSSSDQGTCVEDLPDDVISLIFSQLGPRQVVRASFASRKWLHLPSRLTSLKFDSNTMGQHCPADKYSFINGVNRFLQHYSSLQSGDPLNVFSVYFCLGADSSAELDRWTSFALQRGVKALILCLDCIAHQKSCSPESAEGMYIFPFHLLNGSSSALEKLTLRSCMFGQNLTAKLTSLKCLELSFTLLTDADMHRIFCHCPNIKSLVLFWCNLPAKLTVTTSDLTYFMVKYCAGLCEIKLVAGQALTEFEYGGGTIKFDFKDVPRLTNLSFTMNDSEGDDYIFQRLHRDFPAMRSLSNIRFSRRLSTMSSACFACILLLHLHGQMSALKLEVLRLYSPSTGVFSLRTLLEILKACPLLTTFEMVPPCALDAQNSVEFPVEPFHRALKFVKVGGFCGSKDNVDLMRLLVQASVAIDEVVIERKAVVGRLVMDPDDYNRKWLGTEDPEMVVDILRSSMRCGSLTFTKDLRP